MTTYVYGIARGAHPGLPQRADGIGGPPRPVRVLDAGALAALVSDAPEDLRPKRRDLLAHQGVLAGAASAGTVLPMRFGCVAEDDDAVLAALRDREEHHLERLRALDGKAEFNVKAAHDEDAVLHLVLAEDADLRELGRRNQEAGGGSYEERLALGERVTAAVQQRAERDAALVRRALEPTAVECRPGPEGTGGLANLSFLVDGEGAEALTTATETFRERHRHVVLRVTGPLPPYSFVD
ncbi:GvpL/GvpF family gas vesicle protein [Streptomyces sp. CC77]|uniref:GvpL/GvpF family gas vesicle protein n=1 Tax=Streptomyces sp. CC77 TaxID=1906739 RepID=UPI0008DCA45C|nr:GvpL/GvpF family gas vesicle protein [Streptomyces sp. CC77]OII67915.1 gas vesicle protein [Streptomyces sp. CC77]